MFTRIEDCANRALITAVAANESILDSQAGIQGIRRRIARHDSRKACVLFPSP